MVVIGPSATLELQEQQTCFLAAIRNYQIDVDFDLDLDAHLIAQRPEGSLHYGNIICIQCLVGRVKWGRREVFIDWSGDLQCAYYVEDD